MERTTRSSILVISLTLMLASSLACAQAVQSLYSPVIVVRDRTYDRKSPDQRPIQMHEDGAGFARFDSAGMDLSNTGGAGGRFMLGLQAVPGVELTTDVVYEDIVSWHENGDRATVRIMTDDRSLARGAVRWSADDTRVHYLGKRYDGTGHVIESGAFIGEVEWLGSVPVRVFNEHLVATDVPEQYLTVVGVAMASDGQRVALSINREVFDDEGRHVRWESAGMHVAAAPRLQDGQIAPPPATPVRIVLTTADAERGIGAFSPLSGDDRLLYSERDRRNVYVAYLWSVEVPVSYDGTYPLSPTAVTTKTNSSANYYLTGATWSPTAAFVVFCSAKTTWWPDSHVYKIRSDGIGKAVRLTSTADAYANAMWRP